MDKKVFLRVKIIRMRNELNKILEKEDNLLSGKVLRLSEALDKLIIKYYKEKDGNQF